MNERERLIELLCRGAAKTEPCNLRKVCVTFNLHKVCVTTMGGCGFCNIIADYLLANGVRVGKDTNVPAKWIPVTERLPDTEDVFLCWSKDLADMMFCYTSDFKQMEVTHWMQLPQPPKGE